MDDPSSLITVSCENHHEKMVSGLWNFLLAGRGTDFDVQWCGRSIRAHRLLLDVFMTPENLCPWADRLRLGDRQEGASLDALLEFLYIGKVTVRREQLGNLMAAARQSDFRLLVEAVEAAARGDEARPPPVVAATFEPITADAASSSYDAVGVKEQWSDDVQSGTVAATQQSPVVVAKGKTPRAVKRRTAGQQGDRRNREVVSRPYKCEICSLACSTRQNLTVHRRVHTGERPFKCEVPGCPKAFARGDQLKQHTRTHDGARPFQCDGCEKTFARRDCLVIHARSHSGEKPYQCDQCDKKFVQLPHLIIHTRGHLGVKPYKCSLCPKAFTRRINLKRHTLRHSGQKPYKCDFCPKGFCTPPALTRHMRINHKAKLRAQQLAAEAKEKELAESGMTLPVPVDAASTAISVVNLVP